MNATITPLELFGFIFSDSYINLPIVGEPGRILMPTHNAYLTMFSFEILVGAMMASWLSNTVWLQTPE